MKKIFTYLMTIAILLAIAVPSVLAQGMEKTSAKLYLKQEEYDKAVEWSQNAIDKDPEDAESHFLLGKAYAFTGNIRGMVKEFELFEKYDPKRKKDKERKEANNLRKHFFAKVFNEGVKAFNDQNFDMAAEKFLLAKMLDHTSVSAYQNLAIAYRQVESKMLSGDCEAECDTENAVWNSETNRCEHPNTGNPVHTCCCSEEAKDFLASAIVETYQKMIEMQPDSVQHYLGLSEYHESHQNFEKSIEVLEAAEAKKPGDPQILSELAIAYDFTGTSDKAFQTYERALQNDPSNADLRFNYGRLFLLREDYPEAIEQFSAVLENNPEDFESNYNVGVSHLKIGEEADKMAREIDEEASNARQVDARVDSLRALAKEHFTSAVPYLERASKLQPEQSAVWYNLAVGYTRTGKSEKAKEAFAKAEKIDGGE